ncbi:alpha/beta-hydrolase [Gloeophyllum trabeum ATCC 11539]|uniref:Alpha/beta-hydrolase n=1 Tax=Gloeophyllum trabeum (strain ATCC 11539 / FP-39264 / Madison 617) TaxID=670483 RepID=S7PPW2_GLOTA|nr:alpha/beta-hydrolase [Gloeophyllum trabeum ATCC 11539]EPQ49951.1 alpha/beta-hydrolase [Gloeophyllum trabeum ATCC 11539]
MSGHTRESVRILSASPGIELDVWLYSPISPAPFPVVVAGHGLSLVKDAGLAAFGEEWASRAHFASLILDYRHFGESGGEPRNLISLEKQLQDYQSVIDWARARPEKFRVDKIVVMGSALSGLHVAELLLRDQRLAGGMAHCPVLDGYATSIAGPVNVRLMFWAFVDSVKGKLGLHPVFIAAVGHPGDLAFLCAPSCYLGKFSH